MTTFDDRMDPGIKAEFPYAMEAMFDMIGPDMGPVREMGAAMSEMAKAAIDPFPGTVDEIAIPGLNGAPDIKALFSRADNCAHSDAVLVWLHGGGYVFGSHDDMSNYKYGPLLNVLSVDYRMAPEWRAPAAAEDACAAIDWVIANAETYGIDPAKIIIGGPSAGGGLAASAALMNRDRGGPELLYQVLIYPMLDDSHDTPSGRMDLPRYVWHRELSEFAWSVYAEEDGASPYAAAIRATDLSGLPPAYVMCGDLDLFRDEDIDYAQRLMAAGIAVDLAIFPGAPHGFDAMVPQADLTRRSVDHLMRALESVLEG